VTDQLTLFSARRGDPETSHQAARDAHVNAKTHRARVLAMLEAHPGGLTDFELAERLGLQQTSAGKRRGELRDAGLVVDSGSKRPAPSGSAAIVWCAA
jgi:DNA-binding transcriptional ArsR family regulator